MLLVSLQLFVRILLLRWHLQSILPLLWLLFEVIVILRYLFEDLIFINVSVTLVVYDQEKKVLTPWNILGGEKESTTPSSTNSSSQML